MASQWKDKRPMAPHLQVWRWHPAMLSSILHRISAIISYVFLIVIAIGLLYLYHCNAVPLEGLVYSSLGAVGFFIGFFAFLFMVLAQIRHLVWDQGKYLEPAVNNFMSWFMIIVAVLGAVLLTYMALGV